MKNIKNDLYLEIENAKELPINFDKNKYEHKNIDKKEFYTCRNWQFAIMYKDYLEK